MPGFEETGIELSFKGDSMLLRAHLAGPAAETEGARTLWRSFVLKDVERREYPVPAERYDQAQAKAVLRNGVLTVRIPEKRDESSGLKIEIVKEGK